MINEKVEVIAPILVEGKEHKEVAAAFNIPAPKKRQQDLQYFTAIFVSSGQNLNHAYFLPSELLKARDSISNKAIDVEHHEQNVVGHIYDKAYMWKDHKVFDPTSVVGKKVENIEELKMDIAIAGIVYRDRFQEIAKEVEEGKWKVSMECYYEDFDIKVGNVVIPRKDAQAMGYDDMVGNFVVVKNKGEEVVKDTMVRILKGILFSGCGFVEKPANPPSVILDVASLEEKIAYANKENLVINLDSCEEYMKAKQADEKIEISSGGSDKAGEENDCDCGEDSCEKCNSDDKEESAIATDDDMMLSAPCPMYKRQVYDETSQEPTKPILHENWCGRFDEACTVPSADATDPACLRWKEVSEIIEEEVGEEMISRETSERVEGLIEELNDSVETAKTYLDKAAKWTRKYINDLPNAAFAVIEPAYTQGKTENKNARHLPHHTGPGGTSNRNLDLPHLRNAMARANQIKPVTDSISQSALQKKAVAHLENHRGALKTAK